MSPLTRIYLLFLQILQETALYFNNTFLADLHLNNKMYQNFDLIGHARNIETKTFCITIQYSVYSKDDKPRKDKPKYLFTANIDKSIVRCQSYFTKLTVSCSIELQTRT